MYKAVCKDDTKTGICPKVNRNEYANCDAECNSGILDLPYIFDRHVRPESFIMAFMMTCLSSEYMQIYQK